MPAFFKFLEERMELGLRDRSPEESVEEFRIYQRQLAELRAKIREAEASSARGESGPLDMEALIARLRERLAKEGITD
jgi:hypothetical protein